MRVVHVERTLIASYDVPVVHYDGLSEADIIEIEKSDPDGTAWEAVLDNVKDEKVRVWVTDEADNYFEMKELA